MMFGHGWVSWGQVTIDTCLFASMYMSGQRDILNCKGWGGDIDAHKHVFARRPQMCPRVLYILLQELCTKIFLHFSPTEKEF